MYLKSLKLENFRKFGTEYNKIEFVDAKSYMKEKEGEEINIAPTTTLLVGKNNTGKTTIVQALMKIIDEKKFYVNDFNFIYLNNLFNVYKSKFDNNEIEKIKSPYIQFSIGIGGLKDTSTDLITNLAPFLVLDDVNNSELEINVKVVLKETEVFIKDLKTLLESASNHNQFNKFLDMLDQRELKVKYYNTKGVDVNFNLKNLIEIKPIKANNIETDTSLTKAFNKIIEYRYKMLFSDREQHDFDGYIDEINKKLSDKIKDNHTKTINDSLSKIESNEKLEIALSADLSFQKLINRIIKYEYIEQEIHIPENQFGLGYTNLMMIIAELMDYMEKYPDDSFNSRVNIISIEEPETFMHPQMQELFIKNINKAITSLLESKKKNVNSQLIITTHSSHILNSKIHSGNTFNNINYLTSKNRYTNVINLHDENIISTSTGNADDLNFLKKHIKYKVSELFFSDAIIFVEGVTEETLLNYYIERDESLNKYYISIFNIDGAHGLVYHNLIKLLRVPALIITDLDIKRSETEKKEFTQIKDLDSKVTTNETIKEYNDSSVELRNLGAKIESDNIYIAYQGEKIEGYFATSFEEAFILTNYNNELLNQVLSEMKARIYQEILGEDEGKQNYEKIKINSYKLQRKLAKSKSDFANKLLYELINDNDGDQPELPKYITDGLSWLTNQLKGEE